MIVHSSGPKNARIMLVGECPGKVETLKGEPFVGPAGRELDRILRVAGIDRRQCRVANTVPIEPPNGTIDYWLEIGKGKVREEPAFTVGRELLIREIIDVNPNVVVALGNAALYALTGHSGMKQWRGSLLKCKDIPTQKVIATYHPSSFFYNMANRYYAYMDLARARADSAFPDLRLPKRNLIIEPSYETAMDFMLECLEQERVGFDIECHKTRSDGDFQDWEMSCFSLSIQGKGSICVPLLKQGYQNYWTLDHETEIMLTLAKILEDPSIIKLGQNLMFDASFMLKKYKLKIWPIHDTMIAMRCICPELYSGLDTLCSIFTREPYYKDDGKQHSKILDFRKFWQYSAKDSDVLFEIFDQLWPQLAQGGMIQTYNQHIEVMQSLLFMFARGMACDTAAIELAKNALRAEQAELTRQFQMMVGKAVNPNSPAQLKQLFYEDMGFEPYVNRGKKGKASSVTVDDIAMKRLKNKGCEAADLVLKIRHASKLAGTYMEVTLDDDQRLRSDMKSFGAATGRKASSQTIFGTGNNIQNQPPEFKQFIIADPGYFFYEFDYSQAENRIVAVIAPEPIMIDAFRTGKDVHSLTGALISGMSYEEVKAANKAYEEAKKDGISTAPFCAPIGSRNKPWRFWGKSSNHAFNYGFGPVQFSLKYEVPQAEGAAIRAAYYRMYPGIVDYQRWVKETVCRPGGDRILTNCLGRKRKFITDNEFAMYAQIPQSTVADMIDRFGLIPMYRDQDKFGPCEILNQVHDSIWFQISYMRYDVEVHARCLLALKESMLQPVTWKGELIEIPVEAKIGTSAGRLASLDLNLGVKELAEQIRERGNALLEHTTHGEKKA